MNTYLIIKWLHILSSVLLVGTGFGSAFYMFFANRSGNLAAQAVVTRLVVRADWWFTTPAGIVQPISGFYLMSLTGWSLSWDTPWILASLILYVIAGLCWLPVVWLQIRMSDMAEQALREGRELPEKYFRYARRWELLGYPAFIAMLGIYYLMVNKPLLWG
ncbi:MAG: DUF2269 domain-containing protein [Pseudomonadota bacterium]|nr:DUF2269 domain-containing protein [Pseudomonadota bacterium]